MVRIEKDGKIEQLDLAMPKSYWMRTRKPTVDYLRDTPFATDRQLEDQRIQQMVNRNPQLYNPTKVDKVRSQVIVAPKGESRSVAMKANALNKFVREASGVHNYTIVAPPKQVINDSHSKEILDPETNPRVRSYAVEAKQKPVLCSFGHRPSSASRTFHPATMKLKLRHGAIVPALDPHRTTVGLPVAVLKKVISAPPIVNVLEEARMASQPPSPSDTPINSKPGSPINGQRSSYNDLFLSKEEQDSLFSGTSGRQRLTPIQKGGGGSQATWVSGQTEEKQKSTKVG
ncbi:hypothetical protein EON65_13770 [archaeon]|nr:MAG: hypothetical protein EON65_13770 [archaeon]